LLGLFVLLCCSCFPQRPSDDDDVASDSDGDGVSDSEDACPEDSEQWSDVDGDGVCDELDDACPASADQSVDSDGDGYCDEEDDACPDDATGWTDADGDGVCDEAADACPEDVLQWTDADGDGYCDELSDACPGDANGWTDADGDGYCDEATDVCPEDPLQWSDSDGDGVCDEVDDDCPDNGDGWVDSNGDGFCDGDDDTDGDGVSDAEEAIYGEDCAISDRLAADTDEDGYADNEDLYPRDPYPEYILFRNDEGTIDLVLSNRDGTFQPPVTIGLPYGDTGTVAYRYLSFVVSDFDNNGMTDFLAIGDRDPADLTNPLDLWWFGRVAGPSSFTQRLIDSNLPQSILYTLADLNNDERVDLSVMRTTKLSSGYLDTAVIYSFLNQGTIATANCAWTDDPLNPLGCAFVRVEAADLGGWVRNQWIVRQSRDAVDVNGDGHRDLVVVKHSSGGNSTIPVTLMLGAGDGTFQLASNEMFVHNATRQQSPVNSIVFNDFDGDDLGDVILGLDDDGDAGSAWFYPGRYGTASGFEFDHQSAFECFDLNPLHEAGGEHPGGTGSARSFDFDFDGNQDVMVGYNYNRPWEPPSRTVLLRGLGNGSFAPMEVVRDFPTPGTSTPSYGQQFAIPQRLCQRFPIVLQP